MGLQIWPRNIKNLAHVSDFANIRDPYHAKLNKLDGSTPSSERQNLVEMFNDPKNARVKCKLISTSAGSLGINLHAANHVVAFYFVQQAIYRIWRQELITLVAH